MKPKTTQSESPPSEEVSEPGAIATGSPGQPDKDLINTAPGADTDNTLTTLRSENAQLKAAIRLRDARDSVTAELTKAGARSPELLWDALAREIEFDGEGAPQNVAATVAAIKAKYPEQFGTRVPQSIDGGAGQTDAPRLTKAALAKMKPAEIARLDWNSVKRVLSS